MKRSQFSQEQIAYVLRQVEAGSPVADFCRQVGVSEATFYVWKKKYAGLGVGETVVDQWSRQSPLLMVGTGVSGQRVGEALDFVLLAGPAPQSITVDHGTEFQSRALEDWAYRRGVQLDFTRPGKPAENAFIESFNGRLRDECLNVHQFTSIEDARARIEAWRIDYNQHRPHGSLGHRTPAEFVRQRCTTGTTEKVACSG
jgi:putative transposase